MKQKSKARGVIGIIGAGLMAGLTSMSPMPTETITGHESAINVNSKKDTTPLTTSTINQYSVNPQYIGGLQVGNWQPDYGIPPKVYGECVVRRASHRRTNKKK